ncbi:MAG: twitching motility protein PilT [Deltaproteobacteria bacterium RIFCSPHIGHO2_12_FULL_43_9]|nr:MAG: twitching motility protein PilT [Deltaproteobacteria bacterium RIFCSPHIGHO2_12_FULL_43_9]
MKYLLDTNICIYLIKKEPPQLIEHITSCSIDDIGISAITLGELEYGVEKSRYPDRNRQALNEFIMPINVYPFDADASRLYGIIRADLEKRGKVIGSLDMMIGAHALALELVLVTNNVREFSRIKDLTIENWV